MPKAVSGVTLRWTRLSNGLLMLRYRVEDSNFLDIPQARELPGRRDELWKSTCFEFFIYDGGANYREFNFSPSGDWAAYRFHGYRTDRTNFDPVIAPSISCHHARNQLTASVYISTEEIRAARSASPCAVLIEEHRRPSYWAMKHGRLQPDFHDPACFQARLGPAKPA